LDALLVWLDDLGVGVQEIEEQHKELVLPANRYGQKA